MDPIVKIALAVIRHGNLLVVREKDSGFFILPGGCSGVSEDDRATLSREISMGLGCRVDVITLRYLGEFSDRASDEAGTMVRVRLYVGRLVGEIARRSGIKEARWFNPKRDKTNALAPSIKNKIIPCLLENQYL
jgi:8-oxo-dGTP diphosphatase